MERPLAATNAHRRRSRIMAALAPGFSLGTGAALDRRETQFHNGIHARPSAPVIANAARHPPRTASHTARGGATMEPRLTPAWFTALPRARSAGRRYW